MKVLLVNGSSRKHGCTNAALNEVARALNEEEIETEIFFIGNEALPDCIVRRKCREIGHCIFNDVINEFVEKAKEADGFVFGSRSISPIPAVDYLRSWTEHFIPVEKLLHSNLRRQFCLQGEPEQQLHLMSSTSIFRLVLCR